MGQILKKGVIEKFTAATLLDTVCTPLKIPQAQACHIASWCAWSDSSGVKSQILGQG